MFHTLIVGDLNYHTLFYIQAMQTKTKERKFGAIRCYKSNWSNRDGIFHPNTKYTFCSASHGTFSKTNQVLGNKETLRTHKKIEITPCSTMYWSYISTAETTENLLTHGNWTTLLNKKWVKTEIKIEKTFCNWMKN